MKILINGLSARLGGGQTYLLNLLRHAPPETKIFLLCPDNLDLQGLPATVERVRAGIALTNPFIRALWENFYLGALAKKLGAEVLFSPGGLLPFLLPAKLKTVVTFQNMLPFDYAQRQRYPLGYRRLRDWLLERGLASSMRRADLVIFISRFAQNFIQSALGRLKGHAVTIPHGIDAMFLNGAPARSVYAPKGEYFLYVSFIDHYKSQIEVVRAFTEIRTNETLVLAGAEYAPYGEALRQEIARLGLNGVVLFPGNVPHTDLPALYRHARLNLFASCTENCPNILLEMMASGRPCLVSNRGPMPEFGGECVTYFDPANHAELVERWRMVLSQPTQAEEMAQKAVQQVSAMRWDKAARASWDAIEKTVRAPS